MKKRVLLLRAAAVLMTTATVTSCAALGGVGGGLDTALCPELAGGALRGNFAADARANGSVRAFVQASSDLSKLAVKVDAEVSAACERMGRDLGVSPGEMGDDTASKCGAVTAKIDAILRAGASAKLSASFTPPECKVSGDAYASCSGQCTAQVDPGSIVANCEPGKLSGTCEGTCGGTCDGACRGDCDGACSVKDASGKCAGQCKGTCRGRCDATCHAKCEGTWKAPRCEAKVNAPSAEAKCNASCKAHAEVTAQCSEPKLTIQASANTGEMGKLVATLKANLPVLIRAQVAYGKRIAGHVKTLVDVGADMPEIIGDAGAHAAACVGASANAVLNAQASLRVSVQASASVSGKAGVSGG
jgi:hypothetical protein